MLFDYEALKKGNLMNKHISYVLLIMQLFIGLPLHAVEGEKSDIGARSTGTSQPVSRPSQGGESQGQLVEEQQGRGAEQQPPAPKQKPTAPTSGGETFVSFQELTGQMAKQPEAATARSQYIEQGKSEVAKYTGILESNINKKSPQQIASGLQDVVTAYETLINSYDPSILSLNEVTSKDWATLDPGIQDAVKELAQSIHDQSEASKKDLRLVNTKVSNLFDYVRGEEASLSSMDSNSQATLTSILLSDAETTSLFSPSKTIPARIDQLQQENLKANDAIASDARKKINNNTSLSFQDLQKNVDSFLKARKEQMSVLSDRVSQLAGKARNDAALTYEACACETAYTSALFKSVNDVKPM